VDLDEFWTLYLTFQFEDELIGRRGGGGCHVGSPIRVTREEDRIEAGHDWDGVRRWRGGAHPGARRAHRYIVLSLLPFVKSHISSC
jgi:hypothetical protein